MRNPDHQPPARRLPLVAVMGFVLAAAVFLALACGDDSNNGNGTTNGGGTPPAGNGEGDAPFDLESLGGQIRIDGSSTVFPISAAMAEEFQQIASTRVNVALSGTGGGFEKFCRGEIEISDASRPIEDDEVTACADGGITDIVEFQVAIDALTVMVNPGNDFVDCLTVDQLHQLFSDGGARTWADVNPEWPDDAIEFYYPGTDSGTFDYFVEAIIEGVDENAAHRGDGFSSENDNDLVAGIAGNANAIGYFGFAYFQEAGQDLKAVPIDAGDGTCVEPTFEAALDGSYTPLSRPLFIYTSGELLMRPEVAGFVWFYLDSTDEIVPEVGYVTMPEDLLAEQLAKLEPFLP